MFDFSVAKSTMSVYFVVSQCDMSLHLIKRKKVPYVCAVQGHAYLFLERIPFNTNSLARFGVRDEYGRRHWKGGSTGRRVKEGWGGQIEEKRKTEERGHFLSFPHSTDPDYTVECCLIELNDWNNDYVKTAEHCFQTVKTHADLGIRTHLWSALTTSLPVHRTRLSTVGDRAFPVATARTWNDLPCHVTSASPLPVFRSRLKTHLFRRSFS